MMLPGGPDGPDLPDGAGGAGGHLGGGPPIGSSSDGQDEAIDTPSMSVGRLVRQNAFPLVVMYLVRLKMLIPTPSLLHKNYFKKGCFNCKSQHALHNFAHYFQF